VILFLLAMLMAFPELDSWAVPRQANRVAFDQMHNEWSSMAKKHGYDTLLVDRTLLDLGQPYPRFHIPTDQLEAFLVDHDPQIHSLTVYYEFPVLYADRPIGSICVRSRMRSPESCFPGVNRLGPDGPYNYVISQRRQPHVSQLLGLAVIGDCPNDWRWAYVDTAGSFKLDKMFRNACRVHGVDLVVIGSVTDHYPRAMSVTHHADGAHRSQSFSRWYDAAHIQVDQVLKGEWSGNQISICFPSPRAEGDIAGPACPAIVEPGARRIWLLRTDFIEFVPYVYLEGGNNTLDLEQLEAVKSELMDPAP
jgi:hypothetical protein